MAIVTQKRLSIEPNYGPWKTVNGGVTNKGFMNPYISNLSLGYGVQQTTGFRSGRGVPDPEDIVRSPQNEAGVYNYLASLDYQAGENDYFPGDNGHEFSTFCHKVGFISHPFVDLNNTFAHVQYSGPLMVGLQGSQGPYPGSGTWHFDANYLGSLAISASSPTNPGTNLAEIGGQTLTRSELPSFGIGELASKVRYFAELGSQYLNVVFGWEPFIQDLRSLASAIRDHSKRLRQLQRDSGREVRRGFSFADVKLLQVASSPTLGWMGQVLVGSGVCLAHYTGPFSMTQETHAVWFKGAYKYYLPAGDSAIGKMERYAEEADRLLGVGLNPAVLWDLSPWTWMADWFFDFGNILQNISNLGSDTLVLKYGYLMHHTVCETTSGFKDVAVRINGDQNHELGSVSTSWINELKTRTRSTPYGFGLNTSGFSDQKWAILGALGLTRAPKILHYFGR